MELFAKESFGGIFFFFLTLRVLFTLVCVCSFFPFFFPSAIYFLVAERKREGKNKFQVRSRLKLASLRSEEDLCKGWYR